MTLSRLWPTEDRPLTVDDLDRLPDDGNRYELCNGVLEVTPAPRGNHELVVARLEYLLQRDRTDRLEVLGSVGINLAVDLHRIPDLVVIRQELFEPGFVTQPPVLVIEVASRSTRVRDRTTKLLEYEAFGIQSYWIVEPEIDRPSLAAYELKAGRYEQTGLAVGSEPFHATSPVPVTIVPALLVEPGDAWRSGTG